MTQKSRSTLQRAGRPILNIALFCLVFLIPVALIYDNLIWRGWVFHAGDAWMLYFPAKYYAYTQIVQGLLPLWTPNLFFGFPLFAEAQAGVFYPVHLMLWFFSPTVSYNLSVTVRHLLAGVFMFFYLRRITGNTWAGLVSGFTFSFSGYMVAQAIHENVENALIWLPLILLFLDRWLACNRRSDLICAGLCMGCSFLAGYFYISFLTLITALCYYLFLCVCLHRNRNANASKSLQAIGLAGFGLIAIGLASIQLIPNYELAQESIRAGGLDYQVSTQVSFSPLHLITFIFPKFFGHPSAPSFNWGLWKGNPYDLVTYIGILPLLFVAGALYLRRDRHTLFFFLMLITAIGLALGQFSPLWIIVNKLPVFSMMRNPSRFLSMVVIAGAVLAGLGYDRLFHAQPDDQKKRNAYLKAVGLFSGLTLIAGLIGHTLIVAFSQNIKALGKWFIDRFVFNQSIHTHPLSYYYDQIDRNFEALAGITRLTHPFFYPSLILILISVFFVLYTVRTQTSARWIKPAGVLIVVLDLVWFARNFHYVMPPNIYDQKAEYIAVMEKDRELFRYSFAPLEISMRNYDALRFDQMYAQGYSPLQLQRHSKLIETLRPLMADLSTRTAPVPLINLLNIKYIVTGDSLAGAWLISRFDEGLKVYENTETLPRAFVAHHARVIADPEKFLSVMADSSFNPKSDVLLEAPPPAPTLPVSSDSAGQVTVVRYTPGSVEMEVDSNGGFLVLTDTFYPGWKVRVDGMEQPLLRANYMFRAVQMKPGRHRVQFIYSPVSFQLGAWISALTLAFSIVLFFIPFRGRS